MNFEVTDRYSHQLAVSCVWSKTIAIIPNIDNVNTVTYFLAHELAHQLNDDLSYEQAVAKKVGYKKIDNGAYLWRSGEPYPKIPIIALRTFVTEWRATRYATSLFPKAIYKPYIHSYIHWLNNMLNTFFVCPPEMKKMPKHRVHKYCNFILGHEKELIKSSIGKTYLEATNILLEKAKNEILS